MTSGGRVSSRGQLYVYGVAVPDRERFVHLDGTECVAGYVGESMECAKGGGVVFRMDAYDVLTAPASSSTSANASQDPS